MSQTGHRQKMAHYASLTRTCVQILAVMICSITGCSEA